MNAVPERKAFEAAQREMLRACRDISKAALLEAAVNMLSNVYSEIIERTSSSSPAFNFKELWLSSRYEFLMNQ